MTDAVRKLVEASRKLATGLLAAGAHWKTDDVFSAIAAVEAESAREEAVEHAIARRALGAVREVVDALQTPSVVVHGVVMPGDRLIGAHYVLGEIDLQLSLLGARNVEVVEISRGRECEGCEVFDTDDYCLNPRAPAEGTPGYSSGFTQNERPEWCRSRYGVEAKP